MDVGAAREREGRGEREEERPSHAAKRGTFRASDTERPSLVATCATVCRGGCPPLARRRTSIGMMLCLVPGIILALGWSFAVPLVVDRDLAPIDALKESWRITTG